MTQRSDGPWFCVADPELAEATAVGHYHIYDRTVCEAAERLGYRAVILGRKGLITSHLGTTPIVPTFTYGIWRTADSDYRNGGHRARRRAGWHYFRELRAGLAPYRLKSDSYVFIPSVYKLQIFGWALMGLWSWLTRGPKLAILLRYQHDHYDDDVAAFGFRLLEKLVSVGHVRFFTDSDRLAADYSVLTSAPFDVLPIPHAHTHAPADNNSRGGKLRFGTLGGARDEKGIGDLIDAIEVLNRHRLASDLQFVLHVHSPAFESSDAKLARLKSQPETNVVLIEEALDEPTYNALLHSLDVVVLPYWREFYRSRTSGPLAEAMAAGKPVIVTRETWLDDELRRSGAGLACANRSALDLARTILQMAQRCDDWRTQAKARKADISQEHAADELVSEVVGAFQCETHCPDRNASVVIAPWPLDDTALKTGAGARILCLIKFLAQHCRIVSVAASGKLGVELPRNVLFRSLAHSSWPSRGACERVVMRLGSIERSSEAMAGALLLALRWTISFLVGLWPLSKRLVFRGDRVFFEEALLALPAINSARRVGAATIITDAAPLSRQISIPGVRKFVLGLECLTMRRADHAVTLAKEDADFFAAHDVPNTLMANSIDPNRLAYPFAIAPDVFVSQLFDIRVCGHPVILFVGSASRRNIEAAKAIAAIAQEFDADDPAAPLFVTAGSCSLPASRGCFFSLGPLDELALSALYAHAALVIAPLTFASGVAAKTLEAMALGKAVIGTKIAFRGIPMTADKDGIVADDLGTYAAQIRALLADPARRASLGANAQRAAEPLFYWTGMKAYARLVGLAEPPPDSDRRQDLERRARVVTDAVALAWQKERRELALQIERWWLTEADEGAPGAASKL